MSPSKRPAAAARVNLFAVKVTEAHITVIPFFPANRNISSLIFCSSGEGGCLDGDRTNFVPDGNCVSFFFNKSRDS